MAAPDWQALLITVNDRAAIFSEDFPVRVHLAGDDVRRWFSHGEAHELLYTFAGAWPTLARDKENPAARYLYVPAGDFACRFRAFEVRTASIIVDDVIRLRHEP